MNNYEKVIDEVRRKNNFSSLTAYYEGADDPITLKKSDKYGVDCACIRYDDNDGFENELYAEAKAYNDYDTDSLRELVIKLYRQSVVCNLKFSAYEILMLITHGNADDEVINYFKKNG